tara:strand:- start:188952 stop:189395 length:444 start_codon:yes stop_codon:yes gene_type:complete
MSDELFPKNVTQATQNRIKELAASVYNKEVDDLTKEEIQQVVGLDMSTFPTKLTVGAMATRTTEAKFNTNNYSTSMEIDVSGMNTIVTKSLESVEDKGEMLEAYLSAKSAAFALIKIKYEGTEGYLRDLIQEACIKDGAPKVGRYSS